LNRKQILGHIMAVFTVIVWGITFVFSKKLLQFLTPEQLMVLRFGIAYVVLWILHPKWEKTTWKDELIYLIMGFIGNTCYFMTENNALNYTYAANVSIIVAAAPIFTAILAHFFVKGEKLTKWAFIGFGVAILGVVLVVMGGQFLFELNPVGDILSIGAALSWAIYSVFLKRQTGKANNFTIMRKVMFYGMLTGIPVVIIQGAEYPLDQLFTWDAIGSLLFFGVLGSGICYVLWGESAKHIGIVVTNNYIYAIPFVTVIASWLALDEPLHWTSIIGAVLIVGGIILASRLAGTKKGIKGDAQI